MEEVPCRTSLTPRASTCFVLCFKGVETEGLLDYQGRAGDHFRCTVEPSPGDIRCRRFRGGTNRVFGKPCFCPLPKRGRFDENGENDEFAFYPLKTRVALLRPPKTTKMTKMAGVTREKAWFRKNLVCSFLTIVHITYLKSLLWPDGNFHVRGLPGPVFDAMLNGGQRDNQGRVAQIPSLRGLVSLPGLCAMSLYV